MDGEFPEQFKCPICFEIPEKEIYQCQNGHTLCDVCVQSLSLCPQCRVSLGSARIRSRPLEELLDLMHFNCSYKKEGCKVKVTRREITNHSKNCSFGGDQVPLCKYLGYTCGHIVNKKHLQESLHHFKQDHQSLSTNETTLEIKLNNIKNVDRKMRCLWKPILVNNFNNHFVLIICSFESNVLFSCISLKEELKDKVQIKYLLPSKKDKVPILEWITTPFSYIESEITLKSPPFQFSLNLLAEQYLDSGSVTLQVTMTNNNFSIVNRNKASLVLDSFTMLQPKHLYTATQTVMPQPEFGFGRIVDSIQTNRPFYAGANCNICRVSQLPGLRFKCLQCPDFDLCFRCVEKMEHSFHHFAVIYTESQKSSFLTKCKMSGAWQPYVNVPELNRNREFFGSTMTNAKELHCTKCRNQPDYICLQCPGSFGLCKFCFVAEMFRHYSEHVFALTPTNAAREFVLYILRQKPILPRRNHEL